MSEKKIGTVAAYVRVSSKAQTAATQLDAIERAARARGDKPPLFTYSESLTGSRMQRPELDRLRVAVREGAIRKVYVYRLDRLTRTGIRDTLDVVDEIRRHGCELVTIADGFDVNGPAAEIVLAVLAWAAKMERLAISERISAARTRIEAQGGSWGRPQRMSIEQQAKAIELQGRGHSLRYIASAMKVPRATVARCLKKGSKNGVGKPLRKPARSNVERGVPQ